MLWTRHYIAHYRILPAVSYLIMYVGTATHYLVPAHSTRDEHVQWRSVVGHGDAAAGRDGHGFTGVRDEAPVAQ